jgi:carbonic anhydrase
MTACSKITLIQLNHRIGNTTMCEHHNEEENIFDRRMMLKSVGAISLLGLFGSSLWSKEANAAALTNAQREAMTADDIIGLMKKGNERFRKGKSHAHNYLTEQRRVSASGQYPAAVILSCIDSRAPAETIMDMGIGDVFNARIAGNISNDDILGSMEFACKLAGAKVILVMGHTKCGAIAGAIDKAELGNLTGLLAKIQPAVDATVYSGDRSSKNPAFVDAVARKNVELTIADIKTHSTVVNEMVTAGKLKILGSLYDIKSGVLEFI